MTFYFRHSAPTGQDGLPLVFEPLLGQSYSDVDAIVAFLESLTADSSREQSASNDTAGPDIGGIEHASERKKVQE